ncbi:ABC transporter ATP-binding protein [Gracilimonas mengyeensis]|uniref:Putative ABC transport system ATP-binding protein n=1 Tax=Gracilimonas mengyeensis TaxID=1302730 RepID=A0A521BFJ6_9BACT|nr:ABC transporter ATP-binding protein [Gracilimonas mengyeensis]SMO45867.1 putative ABC transport system ATP-binding protein [Gracilimonas mengyeensis]
MKNEAHIQLNTLTKSYREGEKSRSVLDQLELSVEEGEMIVLLGRSGSGKSTLLNMVSGIDRPDSGDVIIGGTNLAQLSEKDRTLFRRKNIGFVFQSFNLISTLTALENVLLPLKLKGDSDEEAVPKAEQFLTEVGLGDRGDSYPDRLSGGEQQRVAIARALAHEPMLILADEPTGNLDYETGEQILDILNKLVRENGRTIILATHDRDICELADRVVELQGGKLHEVELSELSAS